MKRALSGVLGIVMALIFLAVGIFVIVMGVQRLQKTSSADYVDTKATVTKIETNEIRDEDAAGGYRTEYVVTVEYTVDGKKVVTQLSETPKDFYEGMELDVRYNMNKPTDVILPGSGGAFIIIGMGVVALIAGAVMFLRRLRGR